MQLSPPAVFICCAFLTVVLEPIRVDAQGFYHRHGFGFYGMSPYASRFVVGPGYLMNTVPGDYYPAPLPVFHSSEYVRRLYEIPTLPSPMPYQIPMDTRQFMLTPGVDPLKIAPKPSSSSAQLKSLNLQAKGDTLLREQKWSAAREAYSSAVYAAPDRAESHLRLALCYVAVRRYDSAVKQIKRAVFLDPTLPKTSKKLLDIFGPDSKIALTSIIAKLAAWVKEDKIDSDRLFLLGTILHFNDDPHAVDYLDAARRSNIGKDSTHIALFLKSPIDKTADHVEFDPDGLPKLNNQPVAPIPLPPKGDLRFPSLSKELVPAPVPMPDL